MGRDILAAGVLGVLAVVAVTVWHETIIRVCEWPRRYVRARGYELELARHTAAGLRAELDATQTYATVTIDRLDVDGHAPWEYVPAEPRWQSDIEAAGESLPAWAAPDGDRSSAYGLNSGSSGSDYHGGEQAPFGHAPEDAALDEHWARLMAAWETRPVAGSWGRQGSAGIPQPARDPNSGAGEHGREGAQGTGTATREQGNELAHGDPLGNTGRGGAVPVTPAAAPGPRDATAVASPGPGSVLVTRFDVELAGECARFIRDQNRDVTEYLERLLGITW